MGEDGGTFLMQALNYFAGTRVLCLQECVLDSTERKDKQPIDLTYPSGRYAFDLTKPGNRCVPKCPGNHDLQSLTCITSCEKLTKIVSFFTRTILVQLRGYGDASDRCVQERLQAEKRNASTA